MKIWTLILAACIAGGCVSQPTPLTVMTYNVHHGEGMDKRLDLPRIADVIRKSDAELVALQELDDGTQRTEGKNEPGELAKLLRMNFVFGKAMDYQGGDYGDAVLTRLPIESWRVHHLPYQQGGQREPRCAVAVTIRLKNGQRIVFVSTHFDHTHEPSDRQAQATALRAALTLERLPVVLAGDFNCEPDSPPMRELAKDFAITTVGNPPTCPAGSPRESIDHVLVKPAQRWRVIETHVVDEEVASDHRPVVVKVELTRK